MRPITAKERRGQWLLGAAIAIAFSAEVPLIFLSTPSSSFFAQSIPRWLITAALFYATWRGHRWARWLMVVLLALGFKLALPLALRLMHPLLLGSVVQLGIAFLLLALPPSIGAFQAYQRSRKTPNKAPATVIKKQG